MMKNKRPPVLLAVCITVSLLAAPVTAQQVRDTSQPLKAFPDYQKSQLVGRWYEVARSSSRLEHNCFAVTADVETREDSRLTLKITCHKGDVEGPVLNIDSILVELAPAVFGMRFVRLRAFGSPTLVVLWQADDSDLAVLGTPKGEFGWVWSKSPEIDPELLAFGVKKLEEAGYAANVIAPVSHAIP